MANIVNVGYRSTNFWVISVGRSRMLVDLGWPGKFGKLRANLERMDIPLEELRYALATHYHIDHAGAAQELRLAGVDLLVLEVQLDAIPLMQQFTKPHDNYLAIDLDSIKPISIEASRQVLSQVEIAGEVVHTPGHSDDSVSLLLDSGEAFTGDLTPMYATTEAQRSQVASSWSRLQQLGAEQVYPGHGPVTGIEDFSLMPDAPQP